MGRAPEILIAAGFDPALAEEFIAHKNAMKAPLTARAWTDHCREATKAGWHVVAAAEKVIAKPWKGFEAKYVANERAQFANGRHPAMDTEARNAESRRLLGIAQSPDQPTGEVIENA